MKNLIRNWTAGFCFILGLAIAGGENESFVYNLIGLTILFFGVALIWMAERELE